VHLITDLFFRLPYALTAVAALVVLADVAWAVLGLPMT